MIAQSTYDRRSHQDEYRQTEVQHILVKQMQVARNVSTKLKASSVDEVEELFA